MKKIVFALALLAFTSCTTNKYLMTDEEIKYSGLHIKYTDIFKGDTKIAELGSYEYEIYKGKFVKELSVSVVSWQYVEEMEDLIKFLHTRFPEDKIEVNIDQLMGK